MIIVRAAQETKNVIFFRKGLSIVVIENSPLRDYVAAVKERGWNSCLFSWLWNSYREHSQL